MKQTVLLTPVPAMSGGHGVRLILSEDEGHTRKNFLADFYGDRVHQPFGVLVEGNFARNIGSLFLSASSVSRSGITSPLNLSSTLRCGVTC